MMPAFILSHPGYYYNIILTNYPSSIAPVAVILKKEADCKLQSAKTYKNE
jgi:hypothetical protein